MGAAVRLADDPVAALVPQTGVARLLTTVRHCDASSITAIGTIPGAHPLVHDGVAPAFLALELGAQAAAAMTAMTRLDGARSGPVRGRLVRVRAARFVQTTLPVDTPLDVTADLVAMSEPLAVYRIVVHVAGEERVTATLSTYAIAPPVVS